ncbi:MAG: DNA-protecting protein DprA [Anaerolineaceae bacterium]|nr:DNA-protecting protein DprA [Anaerolineaceae bacterium]
MDQRKFWVAFNAIQGIGPARLQKLASYFPDLSTAWYASRAELCAGGLPERVCDYFITGRKKIDPDQKFDEILQKGIDVLTLDDELYPRRLKEINNPPSVLFFKGEYIPTDEWAVAIVGTRKASSYGKQITNELAAFLASHDITVVSGMARGVDAIAHHAAIKANGRTIAVLGCGVDVIYPPEHRGLSEQIVQQGVLISDYFPGTPPESVNFPPRNRIISGLSLATIVIEAGQKSGALITATYAAEHGRDVYALPGPIYAQQSKGTNQLIAQGAIPLLDYDQLLDNLNIRQDAIMEKPRAMIPENENEEKILTCLGSEALIIDEILNMTNLPVQTISATLSMMELKGFVTQVEGVKYRVSHGKSVLQRSTKNEK